jgi:hydroxymethylbilane synthase
MAQAKALAASLEPMIGPVEIVPIRTSGDAGNREKLGAFVSEIEEALLNSTVDLGLHCLKDIPTREVPGLTFAAYLPREDARDAILTTGPEFKDLKEGAVVGTGSLRRTSQLAAHGKQFQFKPLLGNVDTRLGKLQSGEYDAIVLAMAGLLRLGLDQPAIGSKFANVRIQVLDTSIMLPAAGQATLVVQMRENDDRLADISPLNDLNTEICSLAERSFLARFGGGCSVPVAAYAKPEEEHYILNGLVSECDGVVSYRGSKAFGSEQAEFFGRELAEELGGQGGFEIVQALRPGVLR